MIFYFIIVFHLSPLTTDRGTYQKLHVPLSFPLTLSFLPPQIQRMHFMTGKKKKKWCPGWVAQLITVSSPYTKVAGSFPVRAHRKAMNVCIEKLNNKLMSISLSFSPSASPSHSKVNQYIF